MKLFKDFTETWKGFKSEKIRPLTLILVVLNIVCLLVSNIIAAKTFPLFTTSGGFTVTLTCGLILYPIVLTISDLLAQTDYVWTRRSCHLGFIMNLLMVGAFELSILLPGTTDLSVLHSTFFLLIASLLSFYFGDLINDVIFLKLKNKDGENRGLFKRCILSTLFGQLVDSTIFIALGMNIFPTLFLGFPFMTWPQVAAGIAFQVLIKVLYEIALSPLVIKLCKKFSKQSQTQENEVEQVEQIDINK